MKFTFLFRVVLLVFVLYTTFCYAQPPNDTCLTAEPIVVGVGSCNSILYTNVAATTTGNPATPACWLPNSMSHTVWFSFIATIADVEISTNFGGTLANTQMAVYSGACGSLTLLGCQEDINTGGALLHTDLILHGLTVGNTYYIAIDGNGNTTGTFGVCAQESLPVGPALPTQDCAGSQTLCNLGDITVPDGAGGVGLSQEFPSCFGAPGERSSNWYSFTAATTGTLCFTINPNTSVDYDFAVYNTTASCPGVELTCNWSPTSPITGLGCPGVQCETCITVTAGDTYAILVDRFTAASNSGFTLNFAGTTATFASPNPTFTASTACIGSQTQFTNTTNGNYTYSWNFGDGFTSNLENPTHTYASAGTYSVTLLVTAVPGGCQNSITQSVTVNPLPTVNAGTGGSVCPNACITLGGSTNAVGSTGPVTFNNSGTYAIPDNDPTGILSPITVSGILPATINNTSVVSVCIDLTHTFDGDLDIFLVSPNGNQIRLSSDNGGGNNDYTGTCFSATATTAITAGAAPFTGTFIPEQAFTLLNGDNTNGIWQLFVRDDAGGDIGDITNWSITLNTLLPAYTWSPTTAMTNANTLSPTVCPAATTTYTLTANNGIGCTTTSQVTVNVNAGPTATIAYSSANYCTSAAIQAVTLNGTGAYTGGTYASTAGLSINATTGAITPSTSTPGPYVVSYTIPASGGCPATTVTTAIAISAPPVAGTLSGNQNICIGLTSTFSSTTLGGTWSSSDTTIATINAASGLVTGVASGTATMTYTVLGTGGCANVTATRTVTVTAAPIAGTLSGNQNICVGLTSTFSSTAVGGTWSSSDTTIATINTTSGLITGIAAGTATMTYTVVGTGGCANVTATRTVTVTAAPIAGTLSGNQNICVGLTSTFLSTAVGGTWSSSDTTIATINAASGLITGIAAGTATMTYTVLGTGGCANVTATRTVTVNPFLSPTINCGTSSTTSVQFNWSAVLGATGYDVAYQINASAVVNVGAIGNLLTYTISSLTPGDNVTITLTPTGAAGTCFTANTAICTANNCSPPTASISYLGTPFCDTTSTSQSATLNGTGAFNGGVYSSTSGLSINATTGDIMPNTSTPGPYTVTYTIAATAGCSPVIATTSITITAAPIAGTLSGNQNICVGLTSTFSSTAVGGTWSSSDITVATINPTSGLVTGVAAGTATMTYTVVGTGGCANVTATRTVTVTAAPIAGTLSGNQNICVGLTSTFSSTAVGGTWSSSDTTIATINAASGLVTGVASGTATMTYTVLGTGGCANVTATRTVTVTAAPIAGTLSGNQNICIGLTSTFSSTTLGGTWSSSDTTIATINAASGLVTGVASGTATMTYTVLGTGGCANVTATRTVTVNPFLSPTINCGTSSTTSVQFNWSAVTGATGYDVAYQINASAVVNVGSIGNLLTYSVSSLTPGDNVTITLTPTGAAGTCFTANTAICTANNCSPPTASISYLGTPFCDTTSTSQSVTLNGTGAFNGGVYSSTSGLSINATTGDIMPNTSTPGPYTVTYTIAATAGCSPVIATTSITITAAPVAGTLSGNQNICVGLTSTFSSTAVGGTWSSSDITVATINPTSGLVTGVAAGTATMTYTVLGTGGCANVTATRTVTVTAAPIAGTLSGNQNICVGLNSVFSSTTSGGTWSSSDITVATINPTSGLVTGVASGTATMTYTVVGTGGCANVTATRTLTVTAAPVAGTLSGNQNICVGLTSTFSSTAVGGTWSSSDTTIATINPASGLVTGIAAGTATMTYTVLGTGGCANVTTTRTLTVTAAPVAGILSGNQNICIGLTSTFSSTTLGGTWSSSDTTIATINATSGLVTGVASGTATMTYTVLGTGGCANVTATRTVTVTAAPIAGTLSGNQNICVGLTSTFSSTAVGGTWSSSDTTIATINATSGLVTGVAPGTATMTYTVVGTGGCANVTATRTVTVTAAPVAGTLSGNQNICVGLTSTFSSTAVGGTWSSSDTTIATINAASGLVTGVASGTATMTYTVLGTGGCANVTATRTVTVTAAPIAGTLSGNQNICVGLTSTFSSTAVGGTWSSSDTTIATINTTSGLITGIAAGTATMTYTVVGTGGCANVTATRTVTVTAAPIAGTLSGNQNICVGLTSTFLSTAVGGTWSSSDTTIATINAASGLITGIAAGTATMTYTVLGTGGCANVTATRTVTVNPFLSPTINCGTSSTTSVQFNWSAVTGATGYDVAYQINASAVVNVGAIGNLLTYTISSLTPGDNVTITLTPTGAAGTCFTANTAICTANNCSPPTASISYLGTPFCDTTSTSQSATLNGTGAFNGGVYSSTSGLSINATTGDIMPNTSTPGPYTVTYTIAATAGCSPVIATTSITITAAPIAGTLSGNQNICVGLTSTFSSTAVGGTWSSSDITVATINPTSGLVTGVAAGTATMTYTVVGTGGCANVTATRTVTVTAAPIAGTLSGNQNICVGLTSTFSSTAVGGTWSSSDITVATINPTSGLVTGVASGTATMTYTVVGTGGCANISATRNVTVTAAPIAGTLSGNQNICIGLTSTFSSTTLGGTWSSSDTTIATINAASGLVTGVASGTATMTYTVLGTGGCANVTATRTVTVTAAPIAGTLSGNQNICVGLTSTFSSTAVGGTWSSSDTTIATINAASGLVTGVASGTATMTYTVLGTGGCANVTATRTVTVTAAPIAGTLSGNQNICVGLTSTFSSTAVGGTWSSSDTTIATINATSGLVTGVAPGTATMTYTVVGTGGCANVTATRTVTVTAAPIAGTLSGNQNICVGLTSTFSSTAVGGTWSSSDITVATINPTSGLVTGVASGTATMTYTVVGTGGCANISATRNVTVTAAPIAGTLSGNQNICIGLTSTFSSTTLGGTWSSSDTTIATINAASGLVTGVASGTATMTYTVVGTGGCANVTATRTVTVTAAPIAGTLSGNQVLCVGSSSSFSSTVNGGAWVSSDLSIATINSITGLINGVSAGTCTMTYTVIGTGGCANVSAVRTVTVEPTPSVILSTNPINICSGDSPNIILTADFLGTTFSWTAQQNNVSGATLSGTGNSINPTLTSTTTNIGTVIYTVIPTLNNCVGNPSFLIVKVNPKPIPALNDGTICVDVASGNTTQTHILSTGLNNTNYSHQWYFNGNPFSNPNGNNYSANQAGNYSVIATNINTGCISEEVFATVSASVYTTTFITSVSEAFSDNSYIIINTPSGSGPFQYQLDYGPFQNSNIFYNLISGLHKISIKDESGCTDLHGEIVILNYPKFFTPNGDTYNDTWNIESLTDIPNSGIYIFDRYGKFIKQISPKGKGWDGTFNGYELPSTDYWFTVDFVDPNSLQSSTFKSHFSLKR